MYKHFLAAFSSTLLAAGAMAADPIAVDPVTVKTVPPAGKIRPLDGAPAGAYGATHVEAQLNVDIKEGTKAVHFIRDNNDPYIVTKAYLVQNADPFILRGVLKTIVSASIAGSPVSVESVQYQDGKGVVLVSAEEYRFKDAGNGMSMDALVAALDKKGLPNSSGTVDMAYFPKYNSAATLLEMMQTSGIGFTGAVPTAKAATYDENGLHINKDMFTYALVDEPMNAIVMTAPGYDVAEALRFLKAIDTPAGEIHLTYKLVEIYAENDQKLGLDFQSWKNNDGIDLFSAGGKYGQNSWNGVLLPNNAYQFAEYYNFNPKWNTKYIDFLTTCGKAQVVSTGRLQIADGGAAQVTVTDDFFKVAIEKIDNGNKNVFQLAPESNGKADSKYAGRLDKVITGGIKEVFEDIAVEQGNTQKVIPAGNHFFQLSVAGDVHGKASNLTLDLYSTSLIGWEGSGAPRLATSSFNTKIQLDSNKKEFVVGGITKASVVRSVSGIPLLKDLPVIGWIFSTESDSVKKSQYVLIASAERIDADSQLSEADRADAKAIADKVEKGVQCPVSTLGFQQLLLDK
ncbi:MAG: hypothetical protein J6R85_03955 [Lentisphaeria bacterium]|nr:hypothetical protein [Lentisphaeria bacterium]